MKKSSLRGVSWASISAVSIALVSGCTNEVGEQVAGENDELSSACVPEVPPGPTADASGPAAPGSSTGHCQLKQSEGDFRRFASAIHLVACDI